MYAIRSYYGCAVKAQCSALEVIHNAARGANYNLHAALKCAELAFNGLPAVYGQNGNTALAGRQFAEFFGNLNA